MNRIFLGSALDALADAVPQMGVEDDERKAVQRAVCQACEKRAFPGAESVVDL